MERSGISTKTKNSKSSKKFRSKKTTISRNLSRRSESISWRKTAQVVFNFYDYRFQKSKSLSNMNTTKTDKLIISLLLKDIETNTNLNLARNGICYIIMFLLIISILTFWTYIIPMFSIMITGCLLSFRRFWKDYFLAQFEKDVYRYRTKYKKSEKQGSLTYLDYDIDYNRLANTLVVNVVNMSLGGRLEDFKTNKGKSGFRDKFIQRARNHRIELEGSEVEEGESSFEKERLETEERALNRSGEGEKENHAMKSELSSMQSELAYYQSLVHMKELERRQDEREIKKEKIEKFKTQLKKSKRGEFKSQNSHQFSPRVVVNEVNPYLVQEVKKEGGLLKGNKVVKESEVTFRDNSKGIKKVEKRKKINEEKKIKGKNCKKKNIKEKIFKEKIEKLKKHKEKGNLKIVNEIIIQPRIEKTNAVVKKKPKQFLDNNKFQIFEPSVSSIDSGYKIEKLSTTSQERENPVEKIQEKETKKNVENFDQNKLRKSSSEDLDSSSTPSESEVPQIEEESKIVHKEIFRKIPTMFESKAELNESIKNFKQNRKIAKIGKNIFSLDFGSESKRGDRKIDSVVHLFDSQVFEGVQGDVDSVIDNS